MIEDGFSASLREFKKHSIAVSSVWRSAQLFSLLNAVNLACVLRTVYHENAPRLFFVNLASQKL